MPLILPAPTYPQRAQQYSCEYALTAIDNIWGIKWAMNSLFLWCEIFFQFHQQVNLPIFALQVANRSDLQDLVLLADYKISAFQEVGILLNSYG